MRKDRVLLVEDDSTLSFIIEDALVREGFEVITANNGDVGLRKYEQTQPDIIVTDVMMPKTDGFEMVKLIRMKSPGVPVLFLSARTALDDVIYGFEIGANDYIRKPFQIAELVVRIKVLLRRTGVRPEDSVLEIAECTLDLATQMLTIGGSDSRQLSHMEAVILDELFHHLNEVVEARTLMFRIWQNDDYNNLNRLHGFIYKLRRYLSASTLDILNIRGIGYKLIKRTGQ